MWCVYRDITTWRGWNDWENQNSDERTIGWSNDHNTMSAIFNNRRFVFIASRHVASRRHLKSRIDFDSRFTNWTRFVSGNDSGLFGYDSTWIIPNYPESSPETSASAGDSNWIIASTVQLTRWFRIILWAHRFDCHADLGWFGVIQGIIRVESVTNHPESSRFITIPLKQESVKGQNVRCRM